MLLKGATLKNNCLKDLVSLTDSTNRFSFMAFLQAKNRIYEWINADFVRPLRKEYNQYLRWVSEQLTDSILWNTKILSVKLVKGLLQVYTNKRLFQSKNLVIGTGTSPNIPKFFENIVNTDTIFHNSVYVHKKNLIDFKDKSISVIGGEQSGAEVFLDLITSDLQIKEVTRITERSSFHPIDESSFANEFFSRAWVGHFNKLPFDQRMELNKMQCLLSDGISQETIKLIYQNLCFQKYLNDNPTFHFKILPNTKVFNCKGASKKAYTLSTSNPITDKKYFVETDIIIPATGYKQISFPSILEPIRDIIQFENGFMVIKPDFSVSYSGKPKIFMLNASRHTHGVAEPNLYINAYRAAKIVNGILEREKYITPQKTTFQSF